MPERENIMTVEDVVKICETNFKISKNGKFIYTPFLHFRNEWLKEKVQWLDATEEGVIVIGI